VAIAGQAAAEEVDEAAWCGPQLAACEAAAAAAAAVEAAAARLEAMASGPATKLDTEQVALV
jgi:hypothetical protein